MEEPMIKDPYEDRETKELKVTRDGEAYFWADSENECLIWMQANVPYSWHHAIKHEGWKIEPNQDKRD